MILFLLNGRTERVPTMQTVPLHKDLEILFQKQQEEQRKLNKTAEVRKNLKETQQTLHNAFDKLMERNNDLKMTEATSNNLLASSEEFAAQSRRFTMCWPEWWWWCKCEKQERVLQKSK